MVQYISYNTVPTVIQQYIASRADLMDRYLICQTGEHEYTGLVYNPVTKSCGQYVFTRQTSGGYYSGYDVVRSPGEWDYTITNDLYVCSNVGLGCRLDRPLVSETSSVALTVILCLSLFVVLFRGGRLICSKR